MEKIENNGKVIALVFRNADLSNKGTNFLSPDEFPLQLGSLNHKAGKIVKPHRHIPVKKEITKTQEVLILLEGKMNVDLYNDSKEKIETVTLGSGDVILLASGGHGVEILEDSRIIEVKQGPHNDNVDKEFIE